MKRRCDLTYLGILLITLLVLPGCVTKVYAPVPTAYEPAPPPAPDYPEDVELFFEDLASYGSWVWVKGPGWVWSPIGVSVDWRPYTLGRWVYTEHAWTWVSEEPFGWAVYHYGRWLDDPSHGWVWVPDREWAPAWVSWHLGSGWVGWAPLPWGVTWRAGVGLDWGGPRRHHDLEPAKWCFVKTRDLVEPNLKHHIAPAARNVTLISITNNVTHYTVVDNRIINGGLKVDHVEKTIGRRIPRLHVREADSPEAGHDRIVKDREVVILKAGPALRRAVREQTRPAVRRKDPEQRPAPASSPGPAVEAPPVARPGKGSPKTIDREQNRRLESRQEREKTRLRRIHGWEKKNPPKGVSPQDVQKRQEAEKDALERQQQRERRLLQQRQRTAPAVKGKPASSGSGKPTSAKSDSDGSKADEQDSVKSKSGRSKKDGAKTDGSKGGKSKRGKRGGSKSDEDESKESHDGGSDDDRR